MSRRDCKQTKIFMPKSVFYSKSNLNFYGGTNEQHRDTLFVIEWKDEDACKGDDGNRHKQDPIGEIVENSSNGNNERTATIRGIKNKSIHFYDGYKHFCNSDIFLYEPEEFKQIKDSATNDHDDIQALQNMLNPNLKSAKFDGFTWFNKHHNGKHPWNIALDVCLGVMVMLFMFAWLNEFEKYAIEAPNLIIRKFRQLLHSLEGSPIGLKLNFHLNKFLLDFFTSHVQLWQAFLNLIEPLIKLILALIALLGFLGFSYTLDVLSAYFSIISGHAHCFYTYSAVLYKVEIRCLSAFWKVVRGKRYSVLSKRVESHDYNNQQLFLVSIFFATFLFLFPTVLVYYVVFTVLRLCIFAVKWILKTVQVMILEWPLQIFIELLCGNYKVRSGIHIKPVETATDEHAVFELSVQSPPWGYIFSCKSGSLKETTADEHGAFGFSVIFGSLQNPSAKENLPLKSIFIRILEGEF